MEPNEEGQETPAEKPAEAAPEPGLSERQTRAQERIADALEQLAGGKKPAKKK